MSTRTPRKQDQKQYDRQAHLASLMVPPASEKETHFRHSHWKERRQRVYNSLGACGAGALTLNRFLECGSGVQIQYSPSRDKLRLSGSYCKSRFCEPCMRAKSKRIAANLRDRLHTDKAHKNRFITLTLAHSNTPLREQIKRLYRCFKNLRNTKLWKTSQHGGCFMLEVKHSKTGWHPHLHILSEGTWIASADLSAAWHQVTGDSFIVDVRLIKDDRATATYVTKYITKAVNSDVWSDPMLATEFMLSVKGVRTCATFGTWRKLRLTHCDKGVDDWAPMMSLDKLYALVAEKHPKAIAILKAIQAFQHDIANIEQ